MFWQTLQLHTVDDTQIRHLAAPTCNRKVVTSKNEELLSHSKNRKAS